MSTDPSATAHDAGADQARTRWIALYVLCAGMLMIVLDVTIVNVALPSIQNDLGFSNAGLAWVINAYLITFGGLLLLAGRLGDLFGRRRIFLTGLAVFTLASLACGAAQSQWMLVVARFVQGAGGAMTSAVILGMIVTMFPEPREQAKAIGVYAFVASAGGAVGLLAGGVLTESIDWHWIFFVNVPIGIATAAAAIRLIGRDPGAARTAGTDVPGAVLITAALMVGVYTIVKPAAEDGWAARSTLTLAGIAAALLAAFVVRERTAANPLMPLRIFASRMVTGTNVIQALSAAGMFGTFFIGSLYLQRVLHYDPLQIGLGFLPVTVLMGVLSVRYAEKLVMRFGPLRTMVTGMLLITVGMVLLAQAPVRGAYGVHLLPALIIMGVGGGICFPALMTLAMSSAAPADAGLASGLLNTTGQVGGALGLALIATFSSGRTAALATGGHSEAVALTGGYHLAFWIATGLMLASAAVALVIGATPERADHDAGTEAVEVAGTELGSVEIG